jgi:hypothetical protein
MLIFFLKKLCTAKEITYSEETTYAMGENICRLHT